jgi:hypothetical protein
LRRHTEFDLPPALQLAAWDAGFFAQGYFKATIKQLTCRMQTAETATEDQYRFSVGRKRDTVFRYPRVILQQTALIGATRDAQRGKVYAADCCTAF